MEDDEKSRKLKQAIDILSSIPSSSASDRAVGRTNGGSGASSAAGPSRYRGTHNFGLFHLIPVPPPLPVEEGNFLGGERGNHPVLQGEGICNYVACFARYCACTVPQNKLGE